MYTIRPKNVFGSILASFDRGGCHFCEYYYNNCENGSVGINIRFPKINKDDPIYRCRYFKPSSNPVRPSWLIKYPLSVIFKIGIKI